MVRHRNGRELGTERTNGLIGAWARARSEERARIRSAIEKREKKKKRQSNDYLRRNGETSGAISVVHVERGRLDSCVMMPQIVVALQWSGGENGTGRKATLTIGQIRALQGDPIGCRTGNGGKLSNS